MHTVKAAVNVESLELYSEFLERDVKLDIYLPADFDPLVLYSLLLINDGQDLPKMPFDTLLSELIITKQIEKLIAIGIHCGVNRKMEYGTAYAADFEGRGSRAGLYSKFIFDELLPFIRKHLFCMVWVASTRAAETHSCFTDLTQPALLDKRRRRTQAVG